MPALAGVLVFFRILKIFPGSIMFDFGVELILLFRWVAPAGVLPFRLLSSKLSSSIKSQCFSSPVFIFKLGFSVRCFRIIWLYCREFFFAFGGIPVAAAEPVPAAEGDLIGARLST